MAGGDSSERKGSKSSERHPLVSPACVCWGPHASGGSGGCPGGRGSPGTSGRRTSPARGSCGFWRTTGGSRCDTCCTRSWLGQRRASCRNTSPGPRSHHLGTEDTESGWGQAGAKLQREVSFQVPESTMMSSSSPDPSSSRNTTCFPWRNTVLFPEKPSTFCTLTTPSSRSWASQFCCSSLGSCLQRSGLGMRCGGSGMLISSSGSSLMAWPLKGGGCWSSGTDGSSPAESCLSFLLFFFSFSAFLRSSVCRLGIECW